MDGGKIPVAVVTLSSQMGDMPVKAGAAISGALYTANIGIKKLISNPNIKFLILCGAEVQGHMTGKTIKALLENGIDTKRKSIIVSEGPMPLIENISYEDIERFRNQVKM